MLVFFGVMMAPPSPEQKLRNAEAKSLVNVHKLCLACRVYSREHEGNFPPTLATLVPKYLEDQSSLASPLSPGEPLGYTLTPPAPAHVDSPDLVVLEDKFAPSLTHHRVVAYANGSARILANP